MSTRVALLGGLALACGCQEDAPVAPLLPCRIGEVTLPDGRCQPAGLPLDLACPPGSWPADDGSCALAGIPAGGCAEGFVHDGDRGCDAVLPPGACPRGMMAVPGDTACRAVADCGTGTWGLIPIDATTLYVDGSTAGGNGSALQPFRTIQEAIDAASSGQLIAVAAGSYDEDVIITQAVRLWGRCPELTEIAGLGDSSWALLAGASGVEVHTLAITGPKVGIGLSTGEDVLFDRVWVHDSVRGAEIGQLPGASVRIEGSLFEDVRAFGLIASGATVSLERSVVRGTTATADNAGWGVLSQQDTSDVRGNVIVTGSVLRGNAELNAAAIGSDLTIEGSVLADPVPSANQQAVCIAVVTETASGDKSLLTVSNSLITGSVLAGIYVQGSDATIDATVVRGTRSNGQVQGLGLDLDPTTAEIGSVATVRRSLFVDNEDGLRADGSELTIELTAVRDAFASSSSLGIGVTVGDHPGTARRGTLAVRGSLVERAYSVGVLAAGSDATVEGTWVRETLPKSGGTGFGISAEDNPRSDSPTTMAVESCLVEASSQVGIFAEGSDLTVQTSVVRDTRVDPSGIGGRGINAHDLPSRPGHLSVRGTLVEASHEFGILTTVVAEALIEDSLVRNTEPNTMGQFGDGVAVVSLEQPAFASLRRNRIEQSGRAGVASFGASVALEKNEVACALFGLDGELNAGLAFAFSDLGGNLCGCPEADSSCKVVSSALEPPPPLGSE